MTHQLLVPLHRAAPVGHEERYVAEAISSGHLSGDGPFSRRCHALLEELLGAKKILLTTSCTHALELAALLLDVGVGDEVIVPSFTFVSTANAFVLRGARPVFVDIRADTLNLDERKLEALVTARTRAIVPVHYAGVGCEMDVIAEIGKRHDIPIVEDNAHGLFGSFDGHPLGAFGALAALSFHETKNVSCGEGGALVINDPCYVKRAEILREKGTNRSLFLRGEVDRYTWVDVGSSFLPSDLLAAFLYGQLEARHFSQDRRRHAWERYFSALSPWAEQRGVRMPMIPERCASAYHLFHLLMPTAAARDALMIHLRQRGIASAWHYPPLHRSPMAARLGGATNDCPVSDDVSARLLRLPLHAHLTDQDLERVVLAVSAFAP